MFTTMGSATYFICVTIFVMNFLSIVLSDCGSEIQNQSDSYLIKSVIYNGSINECGCNSENICIRKCCGLNYILNNVTCVFNNSGILKKPTVYKNGDPIKDQSINIRYVPGMVKCVIGGQENVELLELLPDRYPKHGGNIQSDGKLWISSINTFYDHDDYCLDYSEEFGLTYLVCHNNDLTVSDRLNFIGMLISLPFFLVTFIVYALLPERNLHAKALMCHVFAIFVAFLLSVTLYIDRNNQWSTVFCRAIVMIILFCFMASIVWVNVMAFDICSTFTGSRAYSPNKKHEERRRFIVYSIYAWGIPLLFISLVLIVSNTVTPGTWYDPGVRGDQCIINDGYPMLLYYFGPLAILILSNIVMFIITACKIREAQKATTMLTKRGSKKHGPHGKDPDKQMFQLYIRLLFAMGINWSMEIIEWAINWQVKNVPPYVWYVSDFCNAAYGVIVFILFVCKKNIWKALKKRYYKIMGKEQTELSVTASALMTE